jgi:hypothetical protein
VRSGRILPVQLRRKIKARLQEKESSMAVDLEVGKAAIAASPTNKFETFVADRLAHASRRVRLLDVATACLGFLAISLAYGLTMALFDRWLEFSSLTRQLAFVCYLAACAGYLTLTLVLPLRSKINPYFAARRIEQKIPDARNSVVNWVDLRHEPLPAAFRYAIGQRAARDLSNIDVEQAIQSRSAFWLGWTALALLGIVLMLYILSPRQLQSLLKRAFAPFSEASIATRTQILLQKPEGGDVVIPIGHAIAFSVWVEGRVPDPHQPDAVKLLYRYTQTDPYEERPLEAGDSHREWNTTMLSAEVHNGFWYKFTGGDAETPEYHVQTRSAPLVTSVDVTYHYRPYLQWKDRHTHDPNLQALQGTEVSLVVHTNRQLREGSLNISGRPSMPGLLAASDPQTLRFRLVLEKDGNYQVSFISVEGERSGEAMPYTIRVEHDAAPQVELTQPGHDISLPPNGVLRLAGSASDDFGLTGMVLRMKLEGDGGPLAAKAYRDGKALHTGDGRLPLMLDYREFVELEKLRRETGEPIVLKPAQKLEYWLEATDNCDYPGPHTSSSKHFFVTIGAPVQDSAKRSQEVQNAQKEQKRHEEKQDRQLEQQKQERAQSDQSPEAEKQQATDRQQGQNKPSEGEKQSQEQKQKPGQSPEAQGQQPADQQQGQNKPSEGEKQSQEQKQKPGQSPEAQGQQPADQQQGQNKPSEDEKQFQDQKQKLEDAIRQNAGREQASDQQSKQENSDSRPESGQGQAGSRQPEKSNEGDRTKPRDQHDQSNGSGSGAGSKDKTGKSDGQDGSGKTDAQEKQSPGSKSTEEKTQTSGREGNEGSPKQEPKNDSSAARSQAAGSGKNSKPDEGRRPGEKDNSRQDNSTQGASPGAGSSEKGSSGDKTAKQGKDTGREPKPQEGGQKRGQDPSQSGDQSSAASQKQGSQDKDAGKSAGSGQAQGDRSQGSAKPDNQNRSGKEQGTERKDQGGTADKNGSASAKMKDKTPSGKEGGAPGDDRDKAGTKGDKNKGAGASPTKADNSASGEEKQQAGKKPDDRTKEKIARGNQENKSGGQDQSTESRPNEAKDGDKQKPGRPDDSSGGRKNPEGGGRQAKEEGRDPGDKNEKEKPKESGKSQAPISSELKPGEKQGDGKPGSKGEKGKEKGASQQKGGQEGKASDENSGGRSQPGQTQQDKAAQAKDDPNQKTAGAGKQDASSSSGEGQKDGGQATSGKDARKSNDPKARGNLSKEAAGSDDNDKQAGDRDPGAGEDKQPSGKNPPIHSKESGSSGQDNRQGNGAGKSGSRSRSESEPKGSSSSEAIQREAEQLSRDLRSGDPQKRADARKKLDDLRRNLADDASRRALDQRLQQAERDGSEKGEPGGKNQQADRLRNQPGAGDPAQRERTEKPGEAKSGQARGKASPEEKTNREQGRDNRPGKDTSSDQGEPSPETQSGKPGQPTTGSRGGTPGAGGMRRPDGSGESTTQSRRAGGETPPEPEISKAGGPGDKTNLRRAAELQLEDFKKKVNKDILKQANMSEADFQKFMKAYRAMLEKTAAEQSKTEDLAAPHLGNLNSPNQALRRVEASVKSGASEAERTGPALPPPEFREAQKEFSRRLSEIRPAREQK